MCRRRDIASWLAVASRPDLPVTVTRSGVNHTWASYSGSLDGLVRDSDWAPALRALNERGIRVVIANGTQDPVPVPGRARLLARRLPSVRHGIKEHADHLLRLTDPHWCRFLLEKITSPEGDPQESPRHDGNRFHDSDQLKRGPPGLPRPCESR